MLWCGSVWESDFRLVTSPRMSIAHSRLGLPRRVFHLRSTCGRFWRERLHAQRQTSSPSESEPGERFGSESRVSERFGASATKESDRPRHLWCHRLPSRRGGLR
jgi:hypothetical protein